MPSSAPTGGPGDPDAAPCRPGFTEPAAHARAEYLARLAARRHSAALEERRHGRIGALRFTLFAGTGLLAWIGGSFAWDAVWLLVPAALFAGLVIQHGRVARARRRFELGAEIYARGLARLDGAWPGAGQAGEDFLDRGHPYAADLDIFGRGSLFDLLCTARSRLGQETLAAWLSAPADPAEVRARQAAVAELRDRLDLREDLALAGADLPSGGASALLAAWAAAPPAGFPRHAPLLAGALAAAMLSGTLFWALWGNWILSNHLGPFAAAAALALIFVRSQRRRIRDVTARAAGPARDLLLVGRLLERVGRETFQAPRLRALQDSLRQAGSPPEARIDRLRRLLVLLDSRTNIFFAPIAGLTLWGFQFTMAIERWRLATGPAIPAWLRAAGEIEALAALASHAYEHPADPFPEVGPEGGFEGEGLAHPLLPETDAVRNDVRLAGELHLLVVSGSNMSGKSTLLRAVGCNAVLALAGAPVRARRLRLGPLAVGASIRTLDSLQDGTSRFYAEITRLRDLVETAHGPRRLLFLLDELLHGTNSHDRRIGAEAVLRSLVDLGAVGLATTHDLALGAIAEGLGPRAANVHFEDHLEEGRMRFDYLLRPGVITKSNALELMRSVGLAVPAGPAA